MTHPTELVADGDTVSVVERGVSKCLCYNTLCLRKIVVHLGGGCTAAFNPGVHPNSRRLAHGLHCSNAVHPLDRLGRSLEIHD